MLFSTFTLLALASTGFAAPSRRAEITAAPAGFDITSIGVIGTGCPPGSSYVYLSDSNTILTVALSEFAAVAGPGVPISQNRKACQITLGVSVPPGYSFSVKTVESTGYYQLDKGVTASQNSLAYFQGQLSQATARGQFQGPVDGATFVNKEDFDGLVRSPCGQSTVLNLGNDVRVSNSANKEGSGAIITDLIQFKQALHLEWSRC